MNAEYGRVTLHFGTISATRPTDCTARVKLDSGLETYWLPIGQYHVSAGSSAYWMPEVGELVLCALDEKGEQGCVLCGIYSRTSPPVTSGQGLLAIAVPVISIKGNITVEGDLTVKGAVAIQGSHSINGKDTLVLGSVDTLGGVNIVSGQ